MGEYVFVKEEQKP